MRVLVLALLLGLGACVSRAEFAQDVKAWRAYYDNTRPDLLAVYGQLPEPSRGTRLRAVSDAGALLEAEEARAGIAAPASGG